MEGRHRRGNGKPADFGESRSCSGDFFESGFFGFVSNIEAGDVSIGWEFLGVALFQEIIGKFGVISGQGGFNDGVIGLESLDDDFGFVEVSATDATDDLGEELESALFGGKIWQRKTAIGLDDADGGEMGKIEAASESLRADEKIDFAGFDIRIEAGEVFIFLIITVETGDVGFREEVF